jgi:hypothetical protein
MARVPAPVRRRLAAAGVLLLVAALVVLPGGAAAADCTVSISCQSNPKPGPPNSCNTVSA